METESAEQLPPPATAQEAPQEEEPAAAPPAVAAQEAPAGSMEEQPAPPPPVPKTVRIRKQPAARRSRADADLVALPEINERFWADLLRTQRDAERATRLQRIADFKLL